MSTIIQTDLRSRIIRATDAIPVEHPIFLIVGQPGICKTSLGFSAKDPLNLDFDHGVYRAVNRRDTWPIEKWSDVDDLMDSDILNPFATIIPDTVGRCVELMTDDIIETTPKYGRDGNLTQQGWGVLKGRFRAWMTALKAKQKDVLLLAHAKEDKDGDTSTLRAEIAGGSYGEILKCADFVGTIYMVGKKRMLDFNPTERWIGKNPAGWRPMEIPAAEKAQHFMAELFESGRQALGKISEASAELAVQVDDWRAAIHTYSSAHEFNRALPDLSKLAPIVRSQVLVLLSERATTLGLPFDKTKKQFVQPAAPPPAPSDLAGVFA